MKNIKKDARKIKTPWPTKDAMEQVYTKKLWGSNDTEFYSGEGSHNPEIVIPYIEVVGSFLESFKKPLIVCDLGCGDFNIGKNLVKFTQQYIAVDIVPALVACNKDKYVASNLEFQCLDIAKDELPQGDCALIRQVLQHLSNAEINSVADKLYNFKYVILTEHLPEEDFIPNLDIISGQGIRLKKKSGVDLLSLPFNLKVKEEKELLTITLNNHRGKIVTTLYTIH